VNRSLKYSITLNADAQAVMLMIQCLTRINTYRRDDVLRAVAAYFGFRLERL